MSAKLDDFGDVLTREDLAKLLQLSVRTVRKWETQQRATGIRCLPVEIPGLSHRYTKDAVRHWLKVGVPQIAGRRKAA
jgi:hypothetical protein